MINRLPKHRNISCGLRDKSVNSGKSNNQAMRIDIIGIAIRKQQCEGNDFVTSVVICSVTVGEVHVVKLPTGKFRTKIRPSYRIATCSVISSAPLAIPVFLPIKTVN